MTVPVLLDEMADKLRTAGIESPRREARLLLSYALGLPPDDLVLTGAPTHLPADVTAKLLDGLKRRLAREPMAYILGRREFWSLDFAVGPGVLVPRPDSETLIEQALIEFPDREGLLATLDLGTGSGCLLLAFLSERPNARGIGIDSSENALVYARANAISLGLGTRAAFDLHDWSEGVPARFDAIFVNPPYLTDGEFERSDPEVRVEPRAALAAGDDGLHAYRSVAAVVAAALKAKGRAFVEIGRGQDAAARQIFSSAGLETIRAAHDLSGVPRCLVLAAACP